MPPSPPRLESEAVGRGDGGDISIATAAINHAKVLTTVLFATHANAQLCATVKAGVLAGQDIHLVGEVYPFPLHTLQ